MTVSTTTSEARFVGNGVTTIFALGYEVLEASHLIVTLYDSADQPEVQTLNVDYTVSLLADEDGASVTMTAPPAVGRVLEISRRIPLIQDKPFNVISSSSLEDGFDRAVMGLQENRAQLARTVTTRFGESGIVLPALSSRQGKTAKFDANGNLIGSNDLTIDSLILAGRVVTPSDLAVLETTEISVKTFGAVGDGITDDTAAVQAAFSSGYKAIFFPEGTYLLSSQLTATTNLSIYGEGMAATILKWTSAAASTGLSITCGIGEFPVEITRLKFETQKDAVGTAILIDMSEQKSGSPAVIQPRTVPRVLVQNCWFEGEGIGPTLGWNIGIELINVMAGVVSMCFFEGKQNATPGVSDSSNFLKLSGDGAPVEVIVDQCNVFWVKEAVLAQDFEGLYISTCNFVAVEKGVVSSNAGQEPQCQITNSHISAHETCVELTNVAQANINNNLFYSRNEGAFNVIGVDVKAGCVVTSILNNKFVETGLSNFDCIVDNGDRTYIHGNMFEGRDLITVGAAAVATRIGFNDFRAFTGTPLIIDSAAPRTNVAYHPQYAGDLNAIDTAERAPEQEHRIVTGATNLPSGAPVAPNGSVVKTISFDENSGYQIYYAFGVDSDASIFYRTKDSGIWRGWSLLRAKDELIASGDAGGIVRLVDTNAPTAGSQQAYFHKNGDTLSLVTANSAGTFVSVDYQMLQGEFGAISHTFNLIDNLSGSRGAVFEYVSADDRVRLRPRANGSASNVIDIGDASFRWYNAYLVNAPNVSSDARLKEDIRDLNEAERRAAAKIKPKTFVMKDTGRRKIGYVAQEIIEAMASEGLDAFEYGLVSDGETYGVDYDAINSFLWGPFR